MIFIILRVMRMEPGEEIIVVNENGMTAIATISEITNEAVVGTVIEWNNEEK